MRSLLNKLGVGAMALVWIIIMVAVVGYFLDYRRSKPAHPPYKLELSQGER